VKQRMGILQAMEVLTQAVGRNVAEIIRQIRACQGEGGVGGRINGKRLQKETKLRGYSQIKSDSGQLILAGKST
jgi:alkyl hydroperoxide reductase subunit AhpC